jgi:MYXO-CTERM domain-containing protein
VSDPFDTPTDQGTIGAGAMCKAPDCDCVDIGDIQGDFELPRPCEITVNVTASGNDVTGSKGPIAKGDAVVNAKVTADLNGGPALMLDAAACGDAPCSTGRADADGKTTFVVPVVGDTPSLHVSADYTVEADDGVHYYTGSVSVTGCGRDEDAVTEDVDLPLDHAALGDVGAFIDSLGAGPPVTGDGGIFDNPGDDLVPKFDSPKGCACRVGAEREAGGAPSLLLVGALALALGRRRNSRS